VPLSSSAAVAWSLDAASWDVQIAGNDRRDREQGFDLAQVLTSGLDVSDRLNPRKLDASYLKGKLCRRRRHHHGRGGLDNLDRTQHGPAFQLDKIPRIIGDTAGAAHEVSHLVT
jgi:hypothetical protein